MPTFVDFAGMNTLVSSSIDGNTLSSGKNTEIEDIQEDELVGINLHRNGPYGYSTWKQLRVSENPITRNHRETNKLTFVTQPGPVRNVVSNGEFRVRDRYSSLYSYTEPALAQNSYPLVWNVGRHIKDDDGNLDLYQFSILSSYGNSKISFANDEVNEVLRTEIDGKNTEYPEISKMYLENGLNKEESPLTYWEFLQYRETIHPKLPYQFLNNHRTRPTFDSFYRYDRLTRTKQLEETDFGFAPDESFGGFEFSIYARQSTWPLDEHEDFIDRDFLNLSSSIDWENYDYDLTERFSGFSSNTSMGRFGEGILMNSYTQFWHELPSNQPVSSNLISLNDNFGVGPLYTRRTSIDTTQSVSNPTGMPIPQTSSLSSITTYQGGALWEAGDRRWIRDENNNYMSASRQPFFDTYENHTSDIRLIGKNYTILPEFRMSTQIEDILKSSENFLDQDLFEVVGGISGSEDSSKSDFYKVYSNTDFMRQFEVLESDHDGFANEKVLSLRCKALKKFVPYEGFYPCQVTADLAKQFYDSYGSKIDLNISTANTSSANFLKQAMLTPLFAPGVLFNTIKSGIAVDYPIVFNGLTNSSSFIYQNFDKRIPFEALVEPEKHLTNIEIANNEPSQYANLSASVIWNGDGDEIYKMRANNFLAEVPEFFLPNKSLTSIVSKKQRSGFLLESGSVYGMRVRMRRSMNQALNPVYNSGSESNRYFVPQDVIGNGLKETFTMYSRPSAFGPPSYGNNSIAHSSSGPEDTPFYQFSQDRINMFISASSQASFFMDSRNGYNFPFTPPYYHGEAWCDITITGTGEELTIKQIQDAASYEYSRFDKSPWESYVSASVTNPDGVVASNGTQGFRVINQNAVQLSSSLNIKGIGKVETRSTAGAAGGLQTAVVDSAIDEDARWVIQTKFETPMLNFNHVSTASATLTLPEWSPETVPRGMWHQYGLIPEESEGVYLSVEPIPDSYQLYSMKRSSADIRDLSEELGFSGVSTKLGRIAPSKTISEAVVAVPFLEVEGKRKFFRLDKSKVEKYKNGDVAEITSGDPQTQIGRSVLMQMEKMKKFVLPPSFDFLNYENVEPIAMYIFEFTHRLTQQDLSDIWQNIPPDIAVTPETEEVAITHPLLKKELLGMGGELGNQSIDLPENLRWMVFKAKQRAASSYFKKTVQRNDQVNTDVGSGNTTVDEFGSTNKVHFNWPYDYFSLVELAKLDTEVEFGNANFDNYVDHLPSWDGQTADFEKIKSIVAGVGDEVLSAPDASYLPAEEGKDELAAIASIGGQLSTGTTTPFGAVMAQTTTAQSGLGRGPISLSSEGKSISEEDYFRSVYTDAAKSWISKYNTYTGVYGYSDSSANDRANRAMFNENSSFATDLRLTNSNGNAIRTDENLKQELMIIFRLTG